MTPMETEPYPKQAEREDRPFAFCLIQKGFLPPFLNEQIHLGTQWNTETENGIPLVTEGRRKGD